MRITAMIYPLLAVLIWAMNAVVNKLSAGVVEPETISFYRWFVAFLILTPFCLKGSIKNWDKIKRHEKASAPLETVTQNNFDIPKGLPALLMAEATQKKAAQMGFDWDNYRGPLAKVYEELRELEKEIGNRSSLEEELGDLLFSIVNLSRFLNLNAEEALRQGVKKFQWRFNQMLSLIEQEGLNSADLSLQEMDYYWNLVKKQKNSGRMVHFTKLEKEY